MKHITNYLLLVAALAMPLISNAQIKLKVQEGKKVVDLNVEVADNQKFTVTWGDGKTDEFDTSTNGSCHLKHTFDNEATDQTPQIIINTDKVIRIGSYYLTEGIGGMEIVSAPELEEVSLRQCNLYKQPVVDLSKSTKIRSISLFNVESLILPKDNQITNIDVSAGDGYGEKETKGSKTTLKELDLSQCSKLQTIRLSSQSDLKEIDLTACKNSLKELNTMFCEQLNTIKGAKLLNLKTLKVDYCALSFDQIPDKKEGTEKYSYSGQADYDIPHERINKMVVDLSNIYKAKGESAEEQITTFDWYIKKGKKVPADKVNNNNGVFTFDESLLEEDGTINLFCKLTNSGFPNMGYGYKTTPTKISNKAIDTYDLEFKVIKGGKLEAFDEEGVALSSPAQIKINGKVKLVATPDEGYENNGFYVNDKFTETDSEDPNVLNIVMDGNKIVRVLFDYKKVDFSFSGDSNGTVSAKYKSEELNDRKIFNNTRVYQDSTIILTATPNEGCVLHSWVINDKEIEPNKENPLEYELVVKENTRVVANFRKDVEHFVVEFGINIGNKQDGDEDNIAITASVDGKVYQSGDEIAKGSEMTFIVDLKNKDSYKIDKWIVNGQEVEQSAGKLVFKQTIKQKTKVEVVVNNTTSNQKIESDNMYIYPAIADHTITISQPFAGECTIYDMAGRKIYSSVLNNETQINVSNLNPGKYIIKLGNVVTRFIKK